MQYGFYEKEITPPLGSIIPGGFSARYAENVLDPLFVRAFVAENDSATVALASVDACGITMDITQRIRDRVSALSPIPKEHVMVMATHAHGAGPTLNWGEEVVTSESYLAFLVDAVADAILMAWKKKESAEAYLSSTDVHGISFVRVYEMKDGTMKTNPGVANADKILRPYTDIDPQLSVLAIRKDGKDLGCVLNFATHPATVANKNITGDYVSALSRAMKDHFGQDYVTVFITGACGNINHVNPFDPQTRAKDRYRTVGIRLAEEAIKSMKNGSLMKEDKIAASCDTLSLRYRKPSAEDLLRAKEHFDSLGDELVLSVPGSVGYTTTFYALQTFLLMADKRTVASIPLQVFQIGSLYIAGTPTQLFNEFGKQIKESTKNLTMVSAFANDYCGYVPAPQCFRPGVYEARLCRTSCLEETAGEKIATAVGKMIASL